MTDAQEPREYGVYGPGTYADRTFTTVLDDTKRIFRLLVSQTPGFTQDEALLSKVRFVGEEHPVLPGPIKAVSVAAAVHAMAGVIADEILAIRGLENKAREVTINTTHAAFWLGTAAVLYLDGQSLASLGQQKKLKSLLPDWERGWHSTPLKLRATGIYPTRTPDVWYCLHGSMNVPPMLRSLGIDPSEPGIDTNDKAAAHIAAVAAQHSAEELEMRNLLGGFCGSICFTPQGWADSPMGKALAAHPLINVRPQTHSQHTAPVPFPLLPRPTDGGDGVAVDSRPLAGIKVVELTRVIAGPQIGAILAAFGADVIRVSAPHLPDLNTLQLTLNAGKQTVGLDLRDAGDRARLQTLVEQADVFVQGFRPGRLAAAPYNLGPEDLLSMAARRGRGIVYVSESCYGPDGYYAERPGWQQVADCASGAAHVTGRALGLPSGECVLPPLPISDMTAGAVGAVGAMLALRDRARRGGSYVVHSSLVAANTYALGREVGLYAPETVRACQQRFHWPEMRAHHHVLDLLQMVWRGWTATEPLASYLREDSGWFQTFDDSAFMAGDGRRLRLSILRPVVRFVVGGEAEAGVEPRWLSPSVPHAHESEDVVAFK